MQKGLLILSLLLALQPAMAQKKVTKETKTTVTTESAPAAEPAAEAPRVVDGDTMNIRFSPITLLVGMVAVQMDFKLGDNWTLGPEVNLWNMKIGDVGMEAYGLGAQSRYFFSGAFVHSAYLGLGLGYATAKSEITSLGVKYTGSASYVTGRVGGGYHWFWNSFNLNVGGYLVASSASKIELKDTAGNPYTDQPTAPGVGAGLEFTIGWKF